MANMKQFCYCDMCQQALHKNAIAIYWSKYMTNWMSMASRSIGHDNRL